MLQQFLPWLMTALVAVSVVTDVRGFIIPNWIPLSIAILAVVQVMALGLGLAAWPYLVTGFAVLAVGFVLFIFNMFGGGDAKLLAALALWAGPAGLPGLIVWTALGGGVLALGVLAVGRDRGGRAAVNSAASESPAAALATEPPEGPESPPIGGRRPLPYAAAIACGAVYLLVHGHGLLSGDG